MRNRQKRVDANQSEIVNAFRQAGATVKIVNQVRGFVDIVVGLGGVDQQVEVKDPSQDAYARRLTKDEQDHWDTWKGRRPVIVENVSQVPEVLSEMVK